MAFKFNKAEAKSYANIVVAEIETPIGTATIRVSEDTTRATIKIDSTGRKLCTFKDGMLYVEKYNKQGNNVLTNIIDMERTQNDCCRAMIHTVSKKTGKELNFCKNYTYEDCTKVDGPFMFKK